MLLLERFGFAPCLASGAGRGIPKGRIIFDGSEEWSVVVGLQRDGRHLQTAHSDVGVDGVIFAR